MKADITKILDAITDKVLAYGPTVKNADKHAKPPPKPKKAGASKRKAKD